MKSIKWHIKSCFENFLLRITIRKLLLLVFTIVVYIYIKRPCNSLIYGVIPNYFFACLIALILSFSISILTKKLFNHLFKRIKDDHLLNWCLLDILVCSYIVIPPMWVSVLCFNTAAVGLRVIPLNFATMPEPSEAMKMLWNQQYRSTLYRRMMSERIIQFLEPVASAMDRDRGDRRHGALYDVFTEQVRDAKRELRLIDTRAHYVYLPWDPTANSWILVSEARYFSWWKYATGWF